jgi:hypothetical protein
MTDLPPAPTEPKRRGRPPKVTIEEPRREALGLSSEQPTPLPAEEGHLVESVSADAETAADEAVSAGASEDAQDHASEPEATTFQLGPPWSAMDTAPLGGKPVWLLGALELPCGWLIPITQAAFHYTTRRRERAPMRWVETAWWAAHDGARTKIAFEPVGWVRYQ